MQHAFQGQGNTKLKVDYCVNCVMVMRDCVNQSDGFLNGTAMDGGGAEIRMSGNGHWKLPGTGRWIQAASGIETKLNDPPPPPPAPEKAFATAVSERSIASRS